ncbi:MAG: hypothetical protein QOJ45_1347 [Verrucomicrobiota bacterium]|jgi:hypothetical protein
MLLRTVLLLFVVAATLSTARAVIDLTPTPHESTCEGFTFKELLFKDGKREIIYQLPDKWVYRAGGDGVRLTPPEAVRADAIIQASQLSAPGPFNEKSLEAAKKQFLGSLPPGSQMITVVTEEQNPVPFSGNPTYELRVSYQIIGETFVRSALFTNVADTQLCFRLTARKSDFEALHRLFRTSIFSWRWIEQRATPDAGSVTASIR